jgi:hypothetical protein
LDLGALFRSTGFTGMLLLFHDRCDLSRVCWIEEIVSQSRLVGEGLTRDSFELIRVYAVEVTAHTGNLSAVFACELDFQRGLRIPENGDTEWSADFDMR